ncbi:NAD(P)-dependent alcohol dehydrogenase [Algimonas porphyrae]|uniref:NADP-dependent alcohol dehydrogenase n=1 Tax=Algimonas porphyrae TaxID=1128113 RepID=A0ABQ5V535_9PROT|nr:NAD(P)-dependent alcohol dehydrogenase [Algimonas porphyrae]GLQ21953.1 NADP-dependent alcohol dehydrogenase [Algimonas porphyrae]
MKSHGYAAHDQSGDFSPFSFERCDVTAANDVAIDILYCGICHSDLHFARNDWGMTVYPVVPGHEIIGRVTQVGDGVTKHKVGDMVAIGCMVDSCQTCDQCDVGDEQFCREGMTATYGWPDKISGGVTYGGFSTNMVAREEFVLALPSALDPARAAPLLCAGITVYSPLKRCGVSEGSRVAVVGLGGLGHMAVKIAAAMGAHVTMISRSPGKAEDAAQLGANSFLLSTDAAAMEMATGTFDVIIDTVPVQHDINPYTPLLDVKGELVLVGQIGPLAETDGATLIFGGKRVSGSFIGGIAETQEMLDFCAEHDVLPDVEMIDMDQVNEAFGRLDKADVRYRFVIDMASLTKPHSATS